jgi:hypothetical protein
MKRRWNPEGGVKTMCCDQKWCVGEITWEAKPLVIKAIFKSHFGTYVL